MSAVVTSALRVKPAPIGSLPAMNHPSGPLTGNGMANRIA